MIHQNKYISLCRHVSILHYLPKKLIMFDKRSGRHNFIPNGSHVTPASEVCTVPMLVLLKSRSEEASICKIILQHAVHTAFSAKWSL
jgi:hypothetical protein